MRHLSYRLAKTDPGVQRHKPSQAHRLTLTANHVRKTKRNHFDFEALGPRGRNKGLRQVMQPFLAYLHLLQPNTFGSVSSLSPASSKSSDLFRVFLPKRFLPPLSFGDFLGPLSTSPFPLRFCWERSPLDPFGFSGFLGRPRGFCGLDLDLAAGRPLLPFLSLAMPALRAACSSGVTSSAPLSLPLLVSLE